MQISAQDKELLLKDPIAFRDLIVDRDKQVAFRENLRKAWPWSVSDVTLDRIIQRAPELIKILTPFVKQETPQKIKVEAPKDHRYNFCFNSYNFEEGTQYRVSPKSNLDETALTMFAYQHFASRHKLGKRSLVAARSEFSRIQRAIREGYITVRHSNVVQVKFLIYKGYIQ